MAAVEKWKKELLGQSSKMLERLLLFTVFLPFFKLPPSPWPNIEKKNQVFVADGEYLAKGNIIWIGGGVG